MCGNSIMGTFDVEKAKLATMTIFEAYGISLDRDVPIAGSGYAFDADGFNAELGVGFEIRYGDERQWFWSAKRAEETEGAGFLGHVELTELEKEINAGKIDVFVCNPYTNYDGDGKMAMSYYLASIVDYLNWIHGDRTIEYGNVLDEIRELAPTRNYDAPARTLWEAGAADDRIPWKMDVPTDALEMATGDTGLLVNLESGASITYYSPEGAPNQIADPYDRINLSLFIDRIAPRDVPVDFDIYLNGDPWSRVRCTFLPRSAGEFQYSMDYDIATKHPKLKTLSIRNVNNFSISLQLKRIAVLDLG